MYKTRLKTDYNSTTPKQTNTMQMKKMSGYLHQLLETVPTGNSLIHHIFERMDEARQAAVLAARRGDIRKFRYAFKAIHKDNACSEHMGVPYRGYNRRIIPEKDYDMYVRLFDTVSAVDAFQFFGVTPEEYSEWMAEWPTFYFYFAQKPWGFTPGVAIMEFPNEEIARQQEGEYPEAELEGNSDLWEERFRPLYDAIDDDPDACYVIKFIGTEPPEESEKPVFLNLHCCGSCE